MNHKQIRRTLLSISVSAAILGLGVPTWAQAQDDDELIEEIIVTGAYLKRKSQFDQPSPISVLGSEDLNAIGAATLDEITDSLTFNTGSENNPDAFTQNFTTGTTNINLRGLGVGSTLVLLNSRRQVQGAGATDKGENFVDTASLVPMIAVDRVETLKDGAASLYGTDAVAGVVNFITRNDFRGFEARTSYQTTTDDDQTDLEVSAIWGIGNDSTDFVISFSYLDRDPLTTSERVFPARADVSIFGQPGSYVVPTQPTGPDPTTVFVWGLAFDANGNGVADFFEGLSATLPALADPDCVAVAAQDPNIIAPATFPAGTCNFDFGSFYNLVPEEERKHVFMELSHDMGNGMHFRGEFGYSDNYATRGNSPSFPALALPGIAPNNPFNPFGVGVAFVGRAVGAFGSRLPSTHDNETWRLAAELSGAWGAWDWNTAFTYAENETVATAGDTLATEFFFALNTQQYNPFGSQYFDQPNDPAVIASFTDRLRAAGESTQWTFDYVMTREWFEMGGGTAGVALGYQHRDQELTYDYDDNANADNFLFLVGNPDFSGERDVDAIFAELGLPVSDNFEIQLALRFEDYGDNIDSADPKIAAIWRPSDRVTLRGSAGTSFRAPSLYQQFGTQTTLAQLLDPLNPGLAFRAVRSQADASSPLVPEEADTLNLGASFQLGSSWDLNIDYWSFDYTDVIIEESAQAILFADPLNPQVIRDPDTGLLLRVNTFFINASSLETDGIDMALRGSWDVGNGTLGLSWDNTWVLGYDLEDPFAGSVDGAGNRNFNNFGTSTPEWRSNVGFTWASGNQAANLFFRHIDSYQDDQNNVGVDSHSTIDAQYNYAFDGGLLLTIGGVNLTDEMPPPVVTNGGFDSKVHDPRGRLAYIRATYTFD
jgi:outer membrane receptor protein involved in Fe transport